MTVYYGLWYENIMSSIQKETKLYVIKLKGAVSNFF